MCLCLVCRSYEGWTMGSTVCWRVPQEVERAWPCSAQLWVGSRLSLVSLLWLRWTKQKTSTPTGILKQNEKAFLNSIFVVVTARYDLNSCFPGLKAANCLLIISTLHFSLFVCKHLLILSMWPSPCADWESVLLIVISVFQCVMTAKLQQGGSLVEDKSQSDKNCGDYKKSDVTTPCQCVCHSKANRTTATAATPVTVDLTVSPCKETAEPPPPAPEHSKYLSVLHLINGSICNVHNCSFCLPCSTVVVGHFQ